MKNIVERFFKLYYRQLCHYAWLYLGDLDTSKDVVHDVFSKLIQQQDNLSSLQKDDAYIKNYLYVATKNSCLNVLSKKKNEEKYLSYINSIEAYEESIELDIIRTEVLASVYAAIETLPESCQLIFKKTYLEGLSNIEVANELNISINTIKTQKQRGMKALKAKLSSELFILFLLIINY